MGIGAPEIIIILIILCIYILFPVWGYIEGKKRSVGPVGGLLLGAILGIIGIIIVYCTPRVDQQALHGFQPLSKAEELQQYKQLFDSCAITEDEYETQKARILS
jgi:hypothetical protein